MPLTKLDSATALNAMTDAKPDAHISSVTRIFPASGRNRRDREIIDLLDHRSA